MMQTMDFYYQATPEDTALPFRTEPTLYRDWARVYYDPAWPGGVSPRRCTILAFPGSGATQHPTISWLEMAVNLGYRVVHVLYHKGSRMGSESICAMNGYGSVSFPFHYASYIQNAHTVETAIKQMEERYPAETIILRGQSLGGGGCVAWTALAEMMESRNGFPVKPQFKLRKGKVLGTVANGMTSGGLSGYRWNDVQRVMNYVADYANKIKKTNTIISYGSDDSYAPLDFSRTIQLGLGKDSSVCIYYPPGHVGHNWINSEPTILLEFINAVYEGRAPMLPNGLPAVYGNGL